MDAQDTPTTAAERGERLKVTRAALHALGKIPGKKPTRRAFAEAVDIPEGRIEKYERGFARVPVELALLLDENYGVSIDWILKGNHKRLAVELWDSIRRVDPDFAAEYERRALPPPALRTIQGGR